MPDPVVIPDVEVWKPVAGWEDSFEVSSLGNLRSVSDCCTFRVSRTASGYEFARLTRIEHSPTGKQTRQWSTGLHRIVCEAFHGRKEPGMDVCHNNGLRDDNRAKNVRWGTKAENAEDIRRHRILSGSDYDAIHDARARNVPVTELASTFKVSRARVYQVLRENETPLTKTHERYITKPTTAAYLALFKAEHSPKAGDVAARWIGLWEQHLEGADPITPASLATFRDKLAGSEYAAASRNRIMGTVGAYLKWLRRHGGATISRDDIMDAFQPFKIEDKLPQVMTPAQIRRFASWLTAAKHRRVNDHRTYAMLRLLTGVRHEEAVMLSPMHVIWETRQLVIDGRKTKRQRSVCIDNSPALTRMLSHLCNIAGREFLCRKIHPTTLTKLFAQAQIPAFQRKVFRSTCAAYAASSGLLNEYQLGSWFGHTSRVAIKHYREPIHGIQGVNVEQWMGAEAEINACVDAIVAYVPSRGLILRT